MAIALVQQATGTSSGTPVVSAAPAGAWTSGNMLVVLVRGRHFDVTSITGGNVTTWVQGKLEYGGGWPAANIWYGYITSGGSTAVTANSTNANPAGTAAIVAAEFSGCLASGDALDGTNGNHGSDGTTATTGTVTPTSSVERLLVACGCFPQGVPSSSPSGWTAFTGGAYNTERPAHYRIEASTSGSYEAQYPCGVNWYSAAIAAIKPSAGGGGGSTFAPRIIILA